MLFYTSSAAPVVVDQIAIITRFVDGKHTVATCWAARVWHCSVAQEAALDAALRRASVPGKDVSVITRLLVVTFSVATYWTWYV